MWPFLSLMEDYDVSTHSIDIILLDFDWFVVLQIYLRGKKLILSGGTKLSKRDLWNT